MFRIKSLNKISILEAIIVVFLVLITLGSIMILVPGVSPHFAIITAIIALIIYGRFKGLSYKDMENSMAKSVSTSMSAIYLFFFIAILITALMMSGAIPTLMYFGLGIISSKTFYLSAFLITAIIGVALGSSLTTVSTLGVALMGLAVAFDASLPITAGAIVSGSFFGDKMSPLSDTTGISASIVGIDLFDHIKNMAKTTIPVFILCSIIYLLLSFNIDVGNLNKIQAFKEDIFSTGLVHWYGFIPFIMLLLMAILKIPSVISMILTSIVSIILALFSNSYSMGEISRFFYSGFSMENIPESIVSLISRGGLSNMFFTITIVILALSLGGLLFSLGIVSTILESMSKYLTSPFKATLAVSLTAVGINYVVGEQYLSILLTGETFKPVYRKLGLHPKNLSRALEDSGTVINPLVPWSVCGSFIANTLHVPVIEYMPFAIFTYLSLIFTIGSGLTGLGLSKEKPVD